MKKEYSTIKYSFRWFWVLCLLLAGCSSSRSEPAVPEQPAVTATPIFARAPTDSPATADQPATTTPFTPFSNSADATATPSAVTTPTTPTSTLTPEAPEDSTGVPATASNQIFLPVILNASSELDTLAQPTQDERIDQVVVYDEQLANHWSAEQSYWVDYDLAATDYAYTGTTAIAITPDRYASKFFLTVESPPEAAYDRDQIIGVSFWLSGGANMVENDDLVVTVVGSNDYTYWVPDDTSVSSQFEGEELSDDLPLFSETRLYYLDINRSIPPGTWVEVIVWLDELIYDSPYNYITGIYLKNDEDFLQTYYIDQISFLLERE
jgi:hypothetical protein